MAGVSSPVLVRCSGTKDGIPCEFTSSEEFYFCPVCGSSSQSNLPSPTITVIKCPGRKNPCGTPIASDSTYNFCKKCGWKIDISLFLQSVKTCPGVKDDGSLCNADLEEGTNYCTNCGYFIEESNEDQSNNIGNIRIGTLGDKSVHSEVETSTVSAKKHDYVDKNKAPNQNKPNKSDDDEVSNGDRLPLTASAASSNGGKPQSSGTEKDTDGGKSTSSVTDKDSDRVKTPSTGTDNSSNGGKPPSSGTDKGSDKEKHTSSGTDKGKNGGKPLSSWTDKGSDKGKPPSSGNDKASDGEKHTSSGTHKGSNGENPTAFGTNVDSDRGKATSSMNDKSSNVGKHIDPDDENESKIAQGTGEETEDCDVSSDEDGDSDNDDDQGDQQEKEERGVRGSSVDPVTKTTLSKSNEISDTSRDNDGRPTNTDEHTKTKALENQYNGGKPKKKKKKKKRGKKKKEEKEGAVQMETKDWDSDDTVEVNFHVLISDAFKLNPNTDKVYVSFHHPYLGGWEGYDKWIMKLEQ